MIRSRRVSTLVFVLAAVALAGCSAGTTTTSRDPFGGAAAASASELRIVTENRYISEVTLYALSSGRRIRMGSLGGMNDGTFTVPWGSQANLRVEIQTLDGSRYTTPSVIANPGEVVLLQIDSRLRYSRIRR